MKAKENKKIFTLELEYDEESAVYAEIILEGEPHEYGALRPTHN